MKFYFCYIATTTAVWCCLQPNKVAHGPATETRLAQNYVVRVTIAAHSQIQQQHMQYVVHHSIGSDNSTEKARGRDLSVTVATAPLELNSSVVVGSRSFALACYRRHTKTPTAPARQTCTEIHHTPPADNTLCLLELQHHAFHTMCICEGGLITVTQDHCSLPASNTTLIQ